VIGFEEHMLKAGEKKAGSPAQNVSQSTEGDSVILAEGSNKYSISGKTGFVTSITRGGKEILAAPLKPHFWRAMTDNDRQGTNPNLERLPQWKWREALNKAEFLGLKENGSAAVTASWKLPTVASALTVKYQIGEAEKLTVSMKLVRDNLDTLLPRFGVSLGLLKGYQNSEFYGRGAVETQWDRKSGTYLEHNSNPIEALRYDYARPQESGTRVDTRYLTLNGHQVPNLTFRSHPHFDFSIWPYTEENLEKAAHPTDLKDAGFWTLHIDKRQMGIGGDDSWTRRAFPMKKYRLESFGKELNFEFSF